MADWRVDIAGLNNCAQQLSQVGYHLGQLQYNVSNLSSGIRRNSAAAAGVCAQLDTVLNTMSINQNRFRDMSGALKNCLVRYTLTETNLKNGVHAGNNLLSPISVTAGPRDLHKIVDSRWFPYIGLLFPLAGGAASSIKALTSTTLGNTAKWSRAAAKYKVSGTSLLGVSAKGEAEGSFINGELKTSLSSKIKMDPKTGSVDTIELINGKVSASGNVAQGKVSGSYGLLSGSLSAEAITASVTGSVAATLYKNGKFTPYIGAELKAAGSLLKGEAKSQLGTDAYNANISARGELGHAEASGVGQAGFISVKDSNGNVIDQGFGVSGKVSAEVCAAKGKISGGFTLAGIKFNGALEGKAGALGVEAGGSVTTGGISGKLGASALLGLGIDFSVDWSGFSIDKLKWWQ